MRKQTAKQRGKHSGDKRPHCNSDMRRRVMGGDQAVSAPVAKRTWTYGTALDKTYAPESDSRTSPEVSEVSLVQSAILGVLYRCRRSLRLTDDDIRLANAEFERYGLATLKAGNPAMVTQLQAQAARKESLAGGAGTVEDDQRVAMDGELDGAEASAEASASSIARAPTNTAALLQRAQTLTQTYTGLTEEAKDILNRTQRKGLYPTEQTHNAPATAPDRSTTDGSIKHASSIDGPLNNPLGVTDSDEWSIGEHSSLPLNASISWPNSPPTVPLRDTYALQPKQSNQSSEQHQTVLDTLITTPSKQPVQQSVQNPVQQPVHNHAQTPAQRSWRHPWLVTTSIMFGAHFFTVWSQMTTSHGLADGITHFSDFAWAILATVWILRTASWQSALHLSRFAMTVTMLFMWYLAYQGYLADEAYMHSSDAETLRQYSRHGTGLYAFTYRNSGVLRILAARLFSISSVFSRIEQHTYQFADRCAVLDQSARLQVANDHVNEGADGDDSNDDATDDANDDATEGIGARGERTGGNAAPRMPKLLRAALINGAANLEETAGSFSDATTTRTITVRRVLANGDADAGRNIVCELVAYMFASVRLATKSYSGGSSRPTQSVSIATSALMMCVSFGVCLATAWTS